MKNLVCISALILQVLLSFSQSSDGNIESIPARINYSTRDAVVTIVWLGPTQVKMMVGENIYFFSSGQRQVLPFFSKRPYAVTVSNDTKTYTLSDSLSFERGKQSILLDIAGDSLHVIRPGNIDSIISSEMIYVETGTFNKGCANLWGSTCFDWEKTNDTVTLNSYHISKFDITQAQWQVLMDTNPSYFKNCSDCPVENVSWNDVQEFIRRLNSLTGSHYRLPTDAEWEFAARGGNKAKRNYFGDNRQKVEWNELTPEEWEYIMGSKLQVKSPCSNEFWRNLTWQDAKNFVTKLNARDSQYAAPTEDEWEDILNTDNIGYKIAGGNNIDEVAWYYGNSDYKTHPVGQKKCNELGLFDMNGNVWQWCSDWFEVDNIQYYYVSASNGKLLNPEGPQKGTRKVVRGLAWDMNSDMFRLTFHFGYPPDYRFSDVGFRLVKVY